MEPPTKIEAVYTIFGQNRIKTLNTLFFMGQTGTKALSGGNFGVRLMTKDEMFINGITSKILPYLPKLENDFRLIGKYVIEMHGLVESLNSSVSNGGRKTKAGLDVEDEIYVLKSQLVRTGFALRESSETMHTTVVALKDELERYILTDGESDEAVLVRSELEKHIRMPADVEEALRLFEIYDKELEAAERPPKADYIV
jgi:hypothetical protein